MDTDTTTNDLRLSAERRWTEGWMRRHMKEALSRIEAAHRNQAEAIDLHGLELPYLPEALFQLSKLRLLDLSDNLLTSLPDALLDLKGLQRLNLSGNRLRTLPPFLYSLEHLEGLFLHGNDDLGLPPEVLGLNWSNLDGIDKPTRPATILEYYLRTSRRQLPLNEAKLILVGFGGVGKTSLARRLIYDQFDPLEGKTEGINIGEWTLRLLNDEEVRLHVWDFGGQEVMHATHQFFLTQRSLYLLVLAGRHGREDADAEYWLTLIASFAPDSPVILVLNKINEHRFEINRRALQRKFPNIRQVVKTDCLDRTGLASLHRAIRSETDGLPNLRDKFPVEWFSIKNRLSTMDENYLTFERYRALCAENGEPIRESQELLAGYLHSLGIVLNYRDDPRLRDTHVLNPHWVTEGVYALLNSKQLAESEGRLTCRDMEEILDSTSYPVERHDFLLQLMCKFDLAFAINDDEYLIPELLSKDQPEGIYPELLSKGQPERKGAVKPRHTLNFEYHYPSLLPEGLLPRFIVRAHVLSTGLPTWRFGVVLSLEDSQALVIADSVGRRITITVAGPPGSRRRLLAIIRHHFDSIHGNYEFRPLEMVPLPQDSRVLVPYSDLIIFEKNGFRQMQKVVGDSIVVIDVNNLLNGIDLRPAAPSGRIEPRPMRAFISYSHRDDRLREEFDTHLKLLQRESLLLVWTDRRITPGTEWRGQIDENLEKADLIFLLVSPDFIASEYCYDVEMARSGTS